MSSTSPSPRRRWNDFARERDARICWLLGMHPVTAAMLVQLGWFPTRDKARKRLNRLVARKRIRVVGTVCRTIGRPEHVFSRYPVKHDALLHEVQLTALCLRLQVGKIVRGSRVTEQQYLPDAEVWINGQLYYVELDRGTMSYAQLARRFEKYEGCPQLVLWVCSTEDRLEGMRRRAETLRHTALFTTLDELLASPHGEVWRDYQGGRASLPREGDKTLA